MPTKELLATTAPAKFDVEFETTKGKFTVHSEREWAPRGVDRFFALVKCGYYDGAILYRVGPTMSFKGGRVVQWGLHRDPKVNQAWANRTIKDEPAKRPHVRGSLNFARGEPNTRSVELAIGLTASPQLDTVDYMGVVGFPSIGEITAGIEVADSFNAKYGNEPNEHSERIAAEGAAFLEREYPGLDRIISARVLEAKAVAK
jgi:peptidyl-prolyl cis-trans isomerase A (cyclophilin A)